MALFYEISLQAFFKTESGQGKIPVLDFALPAFDSILL